MQGINGMMGGMMASMGIWTIAGLLLVILLIVVVVRLMLEASEGKPETPARVPCGGGPQR